MRQLEVAGAAQPFRCILSARIAARRSFHTNSLAPTLRRRAKNVSADHKLMLLLCRCTGAVLRTFRVAAEERDVPSGERREAERAGNLPPGGEGPKREHVLQSSSQCGAEG